MTKKVTETPEEKKARETVETIAQEISKLSRQVQALVDGRLNRRALVILLASFSRLSPTVISDVLDAIIQLEGKALK